MLIAIIGSIALVMSFFFLKPYIKTSLQRSKLLKLFLILIPVAIVVCWIITYFAFYNQPESFETGITMLQNDKEIKNKIGDYESYTYFDKDLPKKTDNPALFRVSLKGSLATIYLTCKMSKDSTGKWKMVEFNQDSIKATTSK